MPFLGREKTAAGQAFRLRYNSSSGGMGLLTFGGGPSLSLSGCYPGPPFGANMMLSRGARLCMRRFGATSQLALEIGDLTLDTFQFLLISDKGRVNCVGV